MVSLHLEKSLLESFSGWAGGIWVIVRFISSSSRVADRKGATGQVKIDAMEV